MKLNKLAYWGALAVVTALGGFWYFVHLRNEREIERLYAEASEIGISQGSEDAEKAVGSLGTHSGQRSTELLLNIAMGRTTMAMLSPDVRIAAIRALSTRADAEAGAALSTLLQPYESLSVRIAAAQALDRLPCNDTCIQGVLHYLERTSHGELDYNQRQKNPPELDASMRARLARNEDKLNAGLYRALEQHPRETVAVLQLVYGLGTLDPSEFGLNVLERVGIVQACPALRASALEMQGDVRFVDAPREKVRQLRESLGCQ